MRTRTRVLLSLAAMCSPLAVAAANLDTIGVTLLRLIDPTLVGTGISVAQAEAGDPAWEVRPSAVGQPTNLFTWHSASGSASAFPNSVGTELGHANQVGLNFYGSSIGAAPGVFHVDNYQAEFLVTNYVEAEVFIPAKVINQSFIFSPVTVAEQRSLDSMYDDYMDKFGVLFCSGVGNGGQVYPPATAYNGIAVGAFGGASSTGPTLDNGRSKPDIVAPADFTSFSTPYVSGAAAILFQAAAREDGGASTAATAGDARTVKALLLNGAIKPVGWTHTNSAPLDTRYGAGVVHVYNSYKQLTAGRHAPSLSTTGNSGSLHPPPVSAAYIPSLAGWNFASISNSITKDALHHYCFTVPAVSPAHTYTFTATLVWNRLYGKSGVNDIDLYLYDMSNSNLVASSTSGVDNVEHVYTAKLAPGRYDLQVLKNGAAQGVYVTSADMYALAFEIFAMPLTLEASDAGIALTWPLTPAGFSLQSASNLSEPISWTLVTAPVNVTNNVNRVTVSATNFSSFYRLVR